MNFIKPSSNNQLKTLKWCSSAKNYTTCLEDFEKLKEINFKSCKLTLKYNSCYLKYGLILCVHRSKENLENSMSLVIKHSFYDVYSNSSKILDKTRNINESELLFNTSSFPEPPISIKHASKFCNYFDAPKNWTDFLIFNFVFLYLFPIFIMSTSYGLIMKKVRKFI